MLFAAVYLVVVLGRSFGDIIEESVYQGVENVLWYIRRETLGEQEKGELGTISRQEELTRFLWRSL